MKKNCNRSHHQKAYQFASYASMTDKHARIKHQAKMSKLLMNAVANGAVNKLMGNAEVVEDNDGKTEGE